MASAFGTVAGLGLTRQLIPRIARAAAGSAETEPRLLDYAEVGMPPELRQPIADLTRLLENEGHDLDPRAYEMTYVFRGATRQCTRVWGAVGDGAYNDAAVVGIGGGRGEAGAFIQTREHEAVDGLRVFLSQTGQSRETARLFLARDEVSRIQVIDDAPHSVEQLEWLGRTVLLPAAQKKNCYCCMGCCLPSDLGGTFCNLAIALGCGTGPVSQGCAKSGYTKVACVLLCFALADVLCNQDIVYSNCSSCSGFCVGQYIFKPRCCPGQTCGHAGCKDG